MTRLRWDAAWAASIGSAWLWGLGFFFSMHVVLTYGWLAFFLFAVPNAVGLGLFGVVLDRKPDLAVWWARIRARYIGFFLLYQIAAIAITLFAAGAGFWQPIHAPTALAAIAVLALSGCLLGHVVDLPGLRRWHPPLLAIGVLCALIALVCLLSGPHAGSVASSTGIDRRFVGLMLPTLVGFLLGPWLDAQHWQRAVAIRAAGRSVGATYIAGAVVFFGLLCLNAALASAAGLVAVRLPLDGVPEGIVAVTTAVATQKVALVAFGLWVTLALLSTLDSFYVATRAILRDVSAASNSTLLALVPAGLATSPFWVLIPALGLAVLGLAVNAPFMAFLIPFATLLVGASACLVAETVLGPRRYDPVVCLCGGVLATVPFAVGYYGDLPGLVWVGSLGALLPALPLLRREDPVVETPVEVEPLGQLAVGVYAETAALAAQSACGFSPDGWFEIQITPTYTDTNSVGNVYFNNHIGFVGKCRELFFYACMPDFDLKTTNFYILTNDFHHKFRREIVEFEPIVVRIRIEKYNRRFVTLEHEILTLAGQIVGRGSQQLMFVTVADYGLMNIPGSVMTAFLPHFQRAARNSNQRPASAVA